MTTTARPILSIGDLARRTGVSVKTIRFYSDQGVLPPSNITDTGYRRYSENDAIRLETVRTLRAAGFDIATIRDMLDRNLAPDEAMRIQIEAIEVQERTLRRQRLMLERALSRDDAPRHPDRGRALALLSSAERSAFLRNQIVPGVDDIRVDGAWLEDFLAAAVEDIPEELDDDQLAAWIDLVEMTDDPSFAEAIRRTATPFWEQFVGESGMNLEKWQEHQKMLVVRVREAVRSGIDPESPAGVAMIADWCDVLGPAGEDVIAHMIDTHDPRLARYWELIATIKRLPYDQELDEGWRWILRAARRFRDR